mmetsp:Transcript_75289/g.212821  ORF Transcript_75289/g.212821 Transcript_75289/m.212821 type:complete len:304 (-) Transcript_75289:749-1660(-)
MDGVRWPLYCGNRVLLHKVERLVLFLRPRGDPLALALHALHVLPHLLCDDRARRARVDPPPEVVVQLVLPVREAAVCAAGAPPVLPVHANLGLPVGDEFAVLVQQVGGGCGEARGCGGADRWPQGRGGPAGPASPRVLEKVGGRHPHLPGPQRGGGGDARGHDVGGAHAAHRGHAFGAHAHRGHAHHRHAAHAAHPHRAAHAHRPAHVAHHRPLARLAAPELDGDAPAGQLRATEPVDRKICRHLRVLRRVDLHGHQRVLRLAFGGPVHLEEHPLDVDARLIEDSPDVPLGCLRWEVAYEERR